MLNHQPDIIELNDPFPSISQPRLTGGYPSAPGQRSIRAQVHLHWEWNRYIHQPQQKDRYMMIPSW